MLTIEPTGAVLGATARGIDLARPLSERSLGQIQLALGRYGVLRFSDQHLDLGELKLFSEQFSKIQGPARVSLLQRLGCWSQRVVNCPVKFGPTQPPGVVSASVAHGKPQRAEPVAMN